MNVLLWEEGQTNTQAEQTQTHEGEPRRRKLENMTFEPFLISTFVVQMQHYPYILENK